MTMGLCRRTLRGSRGDLPRPQHIRGNIIVSPHEGAETVAAAAAHDVVVVCHGRAA
jgi:hypothetical protein